MIHDRSVEILPRVAQLVGERQDKIDLTFSRPRGVEIDQEVAAADGGNDLGGEFLGCNGRFRHGAGVMVVLPGRFFFPSWLCELQALLPVLLKLGGREIRARGVDRVIEEQEEFAVGDVRAQCNGRDRRLVDAAAIDNVHSVVETIIAGVPGHCGEKPSGRLLTKPFPDYFT